MDEVFPSFQQPNPALESRPVNPSKSNVEKKKNLATPQSSNSKVKQEVSAKESQKSMDEKLIEVF